MKYASSLLILMIRAYQIALSPLLPRSCRFSPSCSEFALQCFRTLSFPRAIVATMRRLLCCHPFHPGGVDLPPR